MINNSRNLKGQVTIFIIIAILIVVTLIAYFILREVVDSGTEVPKELAPVYDYYLSCIDDSTKQAAKLMANQGGHLELPEFEPGSDYMPFSSHLDFLGYSVPYWYYVSGNGIAKEQVIEISAMEDQLEEYLKDRISECDFQEYEERGFIVEREDAEVKVDIKDNKIEVGMEMPLTMAFGEVTARQTTHKVSVSSRLGRFHEIATKIYDKEQSFLFLENYGVDILRLYAPVDGTEIGCSPKVWNTEDIKEDLINGLQSNTLAIKVKGDYYSLANENNKYFIQDIGEEVGESESVNFLYLTDWPTKIEIYPDENPLVANPVGLQEGLGMLGFCYVPYHFVYDITYPVLIQIYDAEEMFQFPIAVVIDKNKPREALDVESAFQTIPNLCEHKLSEMTVYTYDNNLDPVEAQIKYKCLDSSCSIGETELIGDEAILTGMFPECVNGYVIASAEGYSTKKHLASTVESGTIEVILEKKYKLDLEIKKGGLKLGNSYAVVNFVKDEGGTTVVYPEQEEVELSAGEYEVKVYIYSNSSLYLEGSSSEECVDVPKSGLGAVFGSTEEKCFTLNVPGQTVEFAVSGGGTQDTYFSASELAEASKMTIYAEDFGVPSKVEDLQINYNNLEINGLEIELE